VNWRRPARPATSPTAATATLHRFRTPTMALPRGKIARGRTCRPRLQSSLRRDLKKLLRSRQEGCLHPLAVVQQRVRPLPSGVDAGHAIQRDRASDRHWTEERENGKRLGYSSEDDLAARWKVRKV